MKIKAGVLVLCLAIPLGCSENKEERAASSNSEAEPTVTFVEPDADETIVVVELESGAEIEDQVLDTQVEEIIVVELDSLDDGAIDQDEEVQTIVAVMDDALDSGIAEQATAHTVYTVRSGDTLGAISKAHNVTLESLASNNRLADRNAIRIGQQLVIK